jgi:predicted TPR repeat methyltransferase
MPSILVREALEPSCAPAAIADWSYPTLVDLGSDFGYYSEMLRTHSDYLVGLDAFAPALQIAKGRKVYDDLIHADTLHLPLYLGKIECVTLFDVIEHLSKALEIHNAKNGS